LQHFFLKSKLFKRGGITMRRTLQIFALVFLVLSFSSSQSIASTIGGSLDIGVPPNGSPSWLWYGLGNIDFSGSGISMVSNDDSWGSSNGWPGVTLEKIFFPGTSDTGGVFTADISMSISGINGGNAFAAVINPDLGFLYDLGLVNTSGVWTGDVNEPTSFSFTGLQIYAIVPYSTEAIVPLPSDFTSWDYGDMLYDPNPYGDRQYSLALLGTLSLTAEQGTYHITEGTFATTAVPEPSTILILGAGLAGVGLLRRRFKN
jgi:hypothetical protein